MTEPNEEVVVEQPFGEDPLLITDGDISEEVYGAYQGFKFVCPICQVPSIMINDDVRPMCLKCGRKVTLRSQIVKNYKAQRQMGASTQNKVE